MGFPLRTAGGVPGVTGAIVGNRDVGGGELTGECFVQKGCVGERGHDNAFLKAYVVEWFLK